MKIFLKRLAYCFGGLLALLLLFHLVENWRGKRAWTQWKQARIAAGDSYDAASFTPPEIPDAENFAAAPRIAEFIVGSKGTSPSMPVLPAFFSQPGALGDWRAGRKADLDDLMARLKVKDLKEVLSPWETELAALGEAARRPHCRLMKNYTNFDDIPQLLGMRARARMLALRSLASLRGKRNDAALEDVLMGLRVAGHLQKEPHLISQLLRIAWVNILMQPVWEGLQEHRWNAAQLSQLQEALGAIDLVASYKLGWQFEHLGMVKGFEKGIGTSTWLPLRLFDGEEKKNRLFLFLRSMCSPKGWLYQNLLTMDRSAVAQFNEVMNVAEHRIGARASQAAMEAFTKARRTPYTFIYLAFTPVLSGQTQRAARAQSSLDMAVIACALERHRLAQGRYPESLAALAPAYLPKAPVDVIEGQALRYAPRGKEGYQLYSLGWNLTDEGGQVAAPDKTGISPQDQGDWVWSR